MSSRLLPYAASLGLLGILVACKVEGRPAHDPKEAAAPAPEPQPATPEPAPATLEAHPATPDADPVVAPIAAESADKSREAPDSGKSGPDRLSSPKAKATCEGGKYAAGESWKASCNTCNCTAQGQTVCTRMACPDQK